MPSPRPAARGPFDRRLDQPPCRVAVPFGRPVDVAELAAVAVQENRHWQAERQAALLHFLEDRRGAVGVERQALHADALEEIRCTARIAGVDGYRHDREILASEGG